MLLQLNKSRGISYKNDSDEEDLDDEFEDVDV